MATPPYNPENSWTDNPPASWDNERDDETYKLLPATPWQLFEIPNESLPDAYVQDMVGWVHRTFGSSVADRLENNMAGNWQYTCAEGKLIGRFRVALEQALDKPRYTNYGMELYLSDNINRLRIGIVFYRIAERLQWPHRTYGDASCMWTYHKAGRATLMSGHARALLLRKVVVNYDGSLSLGAGKGRAWVLPVAGNLYLRNPYGPSLRVFAEVLRGHTGHALPQVEDDRKTRVVATLSASTVQSSYANAEHTHLRWQGEDVAPETLLFDGCYCVAMYNEYSTKGKRICDNCPWLNPKLGRPEANWYNDDYAKEEVVPIQTEAQHEHSDSPHSGEGGNETGSRQAIENQPVETQVR